MGKERGMMQMKQGGMGCVERVGGRGVGGTQIGGEWMSAVTLLSLVMIR